MKPRAQIAYIYSVLTGEAFQRMLKDYESPPIETKVEPVLKPKTTVKPKTRSSRPRAS